jgi:methylenetetrahydrofolate dehydrogenase (NADP+) / methenyltetrahydrofolate cyclohydrolase
MDAVVLGRGVTVGRPLSLLLTPNGIDATVTVAHSGTPDLEDRVRQVDLVVAAVGVPHLVRREWAKPGAVVLDVGGTRIGTASIRRAKRRPHWSGSANGSCPALEGDE